jgi:hypothetical protein
MFVCISWGKRHAATFALSSLQVILLCPSTHLGTVASLLDSLSPHQLINLVQITTSPLFPVKFVRHTSVLSQLPLHSNSIIS